MQVLFKSLTKMQSTWNKSGRIWNGFIGRVMLLFSFPFFMGRIRNVIWQMSIMFLELEGNLAFPLGVGGCSSRPHLTCEMREVGLKPFLN